MTGDWIKMRCDLAEDPDVIAMAEALGLTEMAVIGGLHRFWSWVTQLSRKCHADVTQLSLDSVTHAFIDRYVGQSGLVGRLGGGHQRTELRPSPLTKRETTGTCDTEETSRSCRANVTQPA
jgi:hypothetical protein